LRQYKSMLLEDESQAKFFEKEFNIVGDYLEILSQSGMDASEKDVDMIDQYVEDYREIEGLSNNEEKIMRRAINRVYRLRQSKTV